MCRASGAAGLVLGCRVVRIVEISVDGRVAVATDNKFTPGEHWMGDQDGRIPRPARGIYWYAKILSALADAHVTHVTHVTHCVSHIRRAHPTYATQQPSKMRSTRTRRRKRPKRRRKRKRRGKGRRPRDRHRRLRRPPDQRRASPRPRLSLRRQQRRQTTSSARTCRPPFWEGRRVGMR
jgi:hypothetical protein